MSTSILVSKLILFALIKFLFDEDVIVTRQPSLAKPFAIANNALEKIILKLSYFLDLSPYDLNMYLIQ